MQFVLILGALSSWLSCLKQPGETAKGDLLGYVSEGSDYLWPQGEATVCWEKDIPQDVWDKFAPLRTKIAQHVTTQMSRAGFTMSGWLACEPGSRGMRVSQRRNGIDTDGGKVVAFGRRLDGIYGGVQLWMDRPKDLKLLSPEASIVSEALHEFGHGIGLRHEANRLDSPCAFDQSGGFSERSVGALPQGKYDRDSIMNYCKDVVGHQTGQTLGFSEGDISTIKALYSGTLLFSREDSCRKDGHSWVANNQYSCCRLAPGQSSSAIAKYPLCPEENPNPRPQAPPQPSGLPPADEISTNRLTSVGRYATVVQLPFKTFGLLLICNQGEYGSENRIKVGAQLEEIRFTLTQAAGLGRDTFTCTHIDAYEDDGTNKSLDTIKKMARLTFPTTMVIEKDTNPVKVDHTGLSWKIYENGTQPYIAPISAQTTPTTGPSTHRILELVLDKFPPKRQINEAFLRCGSQKIVGQAVVNSTLSGTISIKFVVPQDLVCSGVMLNVFVPLTNQSPENPQSAPNGRRHFLDLAFDKSINVESQRSHFFVRLQAPSCLMMPPP